MHNLLNPCSLTTVGYQKSLTSQFFPDLDWQLLAEYILPQQQPRQLKSF